MPSDLAARLESVDALPSEPMPAGWSRRNWVQREKIALSALGMDAVVFHIEPTGD
ncbi:MAG TPA: hypothetical protein VM051_02055 [Usitatibacter sp.]|nr:hypothetical protein [Usitatibacter sp.]